MARKTFIDKMNEALGAEPEPTPVVPSTPAEMPYKKGEYLKPWESAKSWTGPRPWRGMLNKSTEGSPPFTDAELKKGYRKLD